jgi:hypothetical protein
MITGGAAVVVQLVAIAARHDLEPAVQLQEVARQPVLRDGLRLDLAEDALRCEATIERLEHAAPVVAHPVQDGLDNEVVIRGQEVSAQPACEAGTELDLPL